jgi:hypothetical protein
MNRPRFSGRAVEVCEERRAIAVELDETYKTLQSLLFRAGVHVELEAAEEAVRLSSRVANPSMRSFALFTLGMLVSARTRSGRGACSKRRCRLRRRRNRDAGAYASEFLANVLDTVGEHLSAARISLTSAQQDFASGDRAYAYAHLFGAAENLNDVGDREAAVILGARVMRQSVAGGWDARFVTGDRATDVAASAHAAEFLYFVRDELDHLEAHVAGMSDKDALALAQERLHHQELLAGVGQRGSSRTR